MNHSISVLRNLSRISRIVLDKVGILNLSVSIQSDIFPLILASQTMKNKKDVGVGKNIRQLHNAFEKNHLLITNGKKMSKTLVVINTCSTKYKLWTLTNHI